MLKTAPTSSETEITEGQIDKIVNWYIKPSIAQVADALEGLSSPSERAKILSQLMDLITKPISEYSAAQIKLSIDEDCKLQDETLKKKITEILSTKSLSSTDLNGIYTALFTMLHEYRFNKSPDSVSAEIVNPHAAVIQDPLLRYAVTLQKTGTLADRLLTDGPKPSSEKVAKTVLDVIGKELKVKLAEIHPLSQGNVEEEATGVNEIKEKKADESKDNKGEKGETTLSAFNIYKKKKVTSKKSAKTGAKKEQNKQVDEDFKLAQSLQQIEQDTLLAQQFEQEENDEAFARKLDRELNRRPTW